MKRKRVSVHRPRIPTRLFVMAIGVIAAIIHVLAIQQFTASDVLSLIIPIILLFDALLLWWGIIFTTQSQVTLYEEGIELQRGTSKVFTKWENVRRMGVRGIGNTRRSGIFLREKVTPDGKGLIDRIIFGQKTNFLPIGQYARMPMTWRIINNEVDQEKLLRTDFGKELHELAPYLFDKYDEWKPKNQLRDDMYEDQQSYWHDDNQMSDEQHG